MKVFIDAMTPWIIVWAVEIIVGYGMILIPSWVLRRELRKRRKAQLSKQLVEG